MNIPSDCLLYYELEDLIDASLPRMYDSSLCRILEKQVHEFAFTNEFTDENPEFALTTRFPSLIIWLDTSKDKIVWLPHKL